MLQEHLSFSFSLPTPYCIVHTIQSLHMASSVNLPPIKILMLHGLSLPHPSQTPKKSHPRHCSQVTPNLGRHFMRKPALFRNPYYVHFSLHRPSHSATLPVHIASYRPNIPLLSMKRQKEKEQRHMAGGIGLVTPLSSTQEFQLGLKGSQKRSVPKVLLTA